jgi:hypothetical protein
MTGFSILDLRFAIYRKGQLSVVSGQLLITTNDRNCQLPTANCQLPTDD